MVSGKNIIVKHMPPEKKDTISLVRDYTLFFRWTKNTALSRSQNICHSCYAQKCLFLWHHMGIYHIVYCFGGLWEHCDNVQRTKYGLSNKAKAKVTGGV